jgi:hypothetical protein
MYAGEHSSPRRLTVASPIRRSDDLRSPGFRPAMAIVYSLFLILTKPQQLVVFFLICSCYYNNHRVANDIMNLFHSKFLPTPLFYKITEAISFRYFALLSKGYQRAVKEALGASLLASAPTKNATGG